MLERIGRPTLHRVALAIALALGAVATEAADRYNVTDLGTLPGKANSWVWQQSVNESGVVAAYANDTDNPNAFFGGVPFLWSRGRMTVLPELPGAIDTTPASLNDSGHVVGWSQPDGEGPHAVVWDWAYDPCGRCGQEDAERLRACDHRRGVSWRIKVLGELPDDIFSHAYAINDRGQAVGDSARIIDWSTFVAEWHAVLWHKGEVFSLPPLPGGGTFDYALDINDRGQIVGNSGPAAALWYKGSVTDLGLIGGFWAQALAINDKGQVVGLAGTAGGDTHAFSWERGIMSDLGAPLGDLFSGAFDINQKGQIVGFSGADITDLHTSKALLWEKGEMIDLQTRIPGDSGWTLLSAVGINERGQISGYGIHDGQYRAFLLTPVRGHGRH